MYRPNFLNYTLSWNFSLVSQIFLILGIENSSCSNFRKGKRFFTSTYVEAIDRPNRNFLNYILSWNFSLVSQIFLTLEIENSNCSNFKKGKRFFTSIYVEAIDRPNRNSLNYTLSWNFSLVSKIFLTLGIENSSCSNFRKRKSFLHLLMSKRSDRDHLSCFPRIQIEKLSWNFSLVSQIQEFNVQQA